jgi:hypothetical protein
MDIGGDDVAVEHMIAGRIRLRFRSRRGDFDFFKQLVSLLSELPYVDEVDANPRTGGVLIRHSATPEQLALLAAQTGLFDSGHLTGVGHEAARARNAVLRNGTPSLPTLGLSALTLFQLTRGRVLGSASEHFWHATRVREFNLPAVALALVGLGVFQLVAGRILAPASSLFVYGLMTRSAEAQSPMTAAAPSAAGADVRRGD